MGARPLRRAIQQLIEDPLSERILWKEFRVGETVIVDTETLTPEAAAEAASKGDAPMSAGEQRLTFRAIEGFEPPPVEMAGAGPVPSE
jgi:ATP-dependent Clp protease ATP-binding subunit ClpC